jgi:hypothetical protein
VNPKELEDKLKHVRACIDDARVGTETAGNALEKARQYLRDLLAGEALPNDSDARAEMITSAQQAFDVFETDIRQLLQLKLRISQELSRQRD